MERPGPKKKPAETHMIRVTFTTPPEVFEALIRFMKKNGLDNRSYVISFLLEKTLAGLK
jgi:hypothetical protein